MFVKMVLQFINLVFQRKHVYLLESFKLYPIESIDQWTSYFNIAFSLIDKQKPQVKLYMKIKGKAQEQSFKDKFK